MPSPRHRLGLPPFLAALAAGAVVLTSAAAPADAHFVLKSPASWRSQDLFGSPQKLGPCGDEEGGTPTGDVTTFQPGQTIEIVVDETIFHPGHYRVALAVHDRSELPPEPVVTPDSTPCGSAEIQDPPMFPVLVDGALVHTSPFGGEKTIQVTLPSDVTCTNCTLQVIEFMSSHPLNKPGGCYYHHCANIAIGMPGSQGAGGGTAAASTGVGGAGGAPGGTGGSATTSGEGGSDGGGAASNGCSCATPGMAGSTSARETFGILVAAAALGLRRRRLLAR